MSYAWLSEQEVARHKPLVILLDEKNAVIRA
jgi:aspartate 1-decarboxylase